MHAIVGNALLSVDFRFFRKEVRKLPIHVLDNWIPAKGKNDYIRYYVAQQQHNTYH